MGFSNWGQVHADSTRNKQTPEHAPPHTVVIKKLAMPAEVPLIAPLATRGDTRRLGRHLAECLAPGDAILLEDLAFFIDVVALSVDRRRLGAGLQGCHRVPDRPREVDVVGVEVSNDAPTRPSPAFVDRVSLLVVRLRSPPEPIGVLLEDRHRLVR